MKESQEKTRELVNASASAPDARTPYQRPSLSKKRSVSRVTLFSGSGATGVSGLTSA